MSCYDWIELGFWTGDSSLPPAAPNHKNPFVELPMLVRYLGYRVSVPVRLYSR